MLAAHPYRLKGGSWGARVLGSSVECGDEIEVTARSGQQWAATVQAVISRSDDFTIVATAANQASRVRLHESGGRGDERRRGFSVGP